MCPTASIALLSEAMANALRLRSPHQSLSTAIVSVCVVGVYLGPEEAEDKRISHKSLPSTRAGR